MSNPHGKSVITRWLASAYTFLAKAKVVIIQTHHDAKTIQQENLERSREERARKQADYERNASDVWKEPAGNPRPQPKQEIS
tara:strand:+ start:562 stop:807 length:246 start_codon:yes stop_codon:yes gene_type:complete